MSPAERLFRQRLERRAAALAPDLQKAILDGWTRIRFLLSPGQLEAFIQSPSAELLLAEVLTPETIARAFAPASEVLRDGVEAAAQAIQRELPAAARAQTFNVLNPNVVEGIRALDSRVVTTLAEDTRETVRAFVENGLRDGVNPRTIAREIRSVVGLAPNQLQAVDNFRAMLEAGDPKAFTRELRDRRFDSTIRKAFDGEGLSPEQVDRMTEQYRKRFIAWNAETNARTAALDAQKLGHDLSWKDAIDRGDVDGERLFKRWSTTLDGRERPEHHALHGEVVRHDEYFSNGEMVPGESTFNCRCIAVMFTAVRPDEARRSGRGLPQGAA
ncbi:MAG: hypothetical protein IPK12_23540 [Gemmatimonadetes bacterium]|nr:hypothetical protein [Gemmatimonadota bacterium]